MSRPVSKRAATADAIAGALAGAADGWGAGCSMRAGVARRDAVRAGPESGMRPGPANPAVGGDPGRTTPLAVGAGT